MMKVKNIRSVRFSFNLGSVRWYISNCLWRNIFSKINWVLVLTDFQKNKSIDLSIWLSNYLNLPGKNRQWILQLYVEFSYF
jgi:hypothetical protein